MEWKRVSTEKDLQDLHASSGQQAVVFFKHSPRCPICVTALKKFEKDWDEASQAGKDLPLPCFIHVLEHRNLSNWLTERYKVRHESPQILLIHQGVCQHHASHESVLLEKMLQDAVSSK